MFMRKIFLTGASLLALLAGGYSQQKIMVITTADISTLVVNP
jgi:hypothetical protein